MKGSKLVIIPTYNEIENIRTILNTVLALPGNFHVLVVDDSSPDGTSDAVLALCDQFRDRLHLEVRKEKNGLGRAYLHGFAWALKRGYDYIFEMDADFSHNPEDLIRLYEACDQEGADISIGSRYIKGVNVVNWPLQRILLSVGASFYVQLITGMRIKDPTAGFVCYRRQVLETLSLEKVRFVGYAFQIEMKFRAWRKGFVLTEVPIVFKDRERGKSKMSGHIIQEAVWGVLRMKWDSIFDKNF